MAEIAPLPSRPAAVIFDMDGLMLDSERAILESLRAAAVDHRADIDPDWWLCLIGHTDAVCRARLGTHIGDSAAAALLDDGHARYVAIAERGLPHRPGIVDLLDLLVAHDMPRAVATSTRSPLAQRKLAAAGLLTYFDVVCTSSDVAQPKPAPDVYLLAAERLGVSPSQCLVLEDSPTGVRAALAAGMTAVQVPDLLAPDDDVRALGHRIVASLEDAQALLAPWLMAKQTD
ncbi:HAD family phosphatase [Luteimonas sp. 3794]|uniref:HAD family hydrolase n=1 Tax=Luteimonas sp. 3794 TaxID=2817730 RepID=UPI0028613A45|nr:HAD family phosphatase [Luteimonas sp. 3794]MDR6993229.1 HAD superfamily hydrolase (TIGR01509 family) [Luteimonas sp. 3794]